VDYYSRRRNILDNFNRLCNVVRLNGSQGLLAFSPKEPISYLLLQFRSCFNRLQWNSTEKEFVKHKPIFLSQLRYFYLLESPKFIPLSKQVNTVSKLI